MFPIELKKQILSFADVILSFALSFVVVVSFSFLLRYIDKQFNVPSKSLPFGYYMDEARDIVMNTPTIAEAATLSKVSTPQKKLGSIAYDAQKIITSSNALVVGAKQKAPFEVGFKNIGEKAWQFSSSQPITLRSSARAQSFFYDSSWSAANIAGTIVKGVAPGEIAYVKVQLEAPIRIGEYTEHFSLFIGEQKMPSSTFDLPIKVIAQNSIVAITKAVAVQAPQAIVAMPTPSPVGVQVAAQRLIQSAQDLVIGQSQKKFFEVGYKNTGTESWISGNTGTIMLRSTALRESYFHDQSWQNGAIISILKSEVRPGEIVYFSFFLEAPQRAGKYKEEFFLTANDKKIPNTELILPITVTNAPATVLATAPIQMQDQQLLSSDPIAQTNPQAAIPAISDVAQSLLVRPGIVSDLAEQEKIIRVGLFDSREPVAITANKQYEVRDGNGLLIDTVPAGMISTVTFDFTTKISTLTTVNLTSLSGTFFKFQSAVVPDTDIVFELPTYSNRPAWSASINDNKYRTSLEVRYAAKTDKLWVINELPLEPYLKGIAETSNSSPFEYQKALLVAARTFAKYHIERATKYLGENFMVRPTDADQVYRGYNAEMRLPNVARAVQDTRGIMVYYNSQLAITPYFSQSDGRTRSWEEVWGGGPKPWLIGKQDPAGAGLPLLGHGVGMSARGALSMALQGKTYEEILGYYYTGIELHKRYE